MALVLALRVLGSGTKELKVFVQYKRGGGVRIAGLGIDNYNGG